jgi:glycerol-3-phosphate acyltransferase PlsY
MNFYLLFTSAYISGSIPFGKIVGRVNGIDIQKVGSGNIGFANSFRTMGWGPSLIVLVGDILKGYIPTFYAIHYLHLAIIPTLLIAGASIAGHIFSPWLKFKGGKGVATMIGVSLALNPIMALIAMLVWAIIFFLGKTASVASIAIAVLMPILAEFLESQLFYFYVFLLFVIILTHRVNIINLLYNRQKEFLHVR